MSPGRWPNGAKAAVVFTIDNMGEAADIDRGLWPVDKAVGSHYSVTEVLPQFLEMLKKYDVSSTYFVEAWNFVVYPGAIQSLVDAGHEVAWHAFRHEAFGKLTAAQEELNFQLSFGLQGMEMAAFKDRGVKSTSDVYRGFRPPGGMINDERTLRLCKEHYIMYISPAAEQAAILQGGQGDGMVVLPFKWSTVDAYYYMDSFSKLRQLKGELPESQSSDTLARRYKAEIDAAIESGSYVSTLFHPFLTNTPERLKAMEEVLQYMVKKRDEGSIWLAKCKDIAEYVSEHPDIVGNDPGWDNTSWR